MDKRTVKRYVGFVSGMAFLLNCFGPCASGQTRMPESSQAIAAKLNIVIVEGEGAINNIKARTARAPIVQVEDENHRPVAGATVAFSLPARGAGGSFLHGGKIFSVLSDQNGRAMTAVIKPNHALGVFKINVSASLHGQLATATVTQTNAIATAGAGSAAAGGATGSSTGGAGAGGTAGTSTATGTGVGATGGATAGGTTGAAGAGGAGAAGAGGAGAAGAGGAGA